MSTSWNKVTNVVRASRRFQDVTEVDAGLMRGPNPHILKKPSKQPSTEAPTFESASNNNQQYNGGGPSTQYGSATPVQSQPLPSQWQQHPYSPVQYNNQPGAGPGHSQYSPYQAQNQPIQGYQYQQNTNISQQPYTSSGNSQNVTSTAGQSYPHEPVGLPNHQNPPASSYGSGPQIEGQYPAQGHFRFERTVTGYGTSGSDRAYSMNTLTRAHTVAAPSGYDAGNRDDIVNSAGATYARDNRDVWRGVSSSESVASGYGSDVNGRGSEANQWAAPRKSCYHCRWPYDEAGRCECNSTWR